MIELDGQHVSVADHAALVADPVDVTVSDEAMGRARQSDADDDDLEKGQRT